MNVIIDDATTGRAMCLAQDIREQVFGKQYYYRLPRLDAYAPAKIITLIAKDATTGAPLATLSVVETSGDAKLHRAVGLSFSEGTRVARYTQMAVLKPYRGLHLPARLIREAQLRFVLPRKIAYSWLLFPAETAHTSFLCMNMGFVASTSVYATEYGVVRSLMRRESAVSDDSSVNFRAAANLSLWPQIVSENEWLAQ